jgi:phosphatidylserine decarboxylase
MSRYSVIAREGLLPLLVTVLAAVLALQFVGFYQSLVLWAIVLLLLFVFRDPEREVPSVPQAVVCPADGKIISIGAAHDPYLNRPSIKVSMQMNSYGTYSTRSPVEGKVLEPPGNPDDPGAPHGVWLQTDEGDDVVLVMNRGPLNNAPRCYVRFGERVGQGQRCGFIHLGARIDLYLPESCRTDVSPGDWVRSGSDVIGKIIRTR